MHLSDIYVQVQIEIQELSEHFSFTDIFWIPQS